MREARDIFWGIVAALVSIALIVGGFSISMAEGNLRLLGSPTPPPDISLTWQPSPSSMDIPTSPPLILSPTQSPTQSPTPSPTQSPTMLPTPINCPPPAGWFPYIVQPGDTLGGFALRYKKTTTEISQANCLGPAGLQPGLVVYLPPEPTRTPIPCGAPHTWIIYIVQQGDTLYHLGQAYGIPYTDIQHANCLPTFDIYVGQRIYVPPWATRTPSPTFPVFPAIDTLTPTISDTPTETSTADTSTPTYTETFTITDPPSP